ncbi:MAG TPA: hypothetical protein PKE27_14530 [Povalibacter sp.]|uniref:hypothetical protein n=1 Tax=Povalibacter sp. TaxID=1962978 RepID=UPI002CA4ED29|nr:hypothetical protein [Povalibacter sp.]HMN45791.1 hypothetical protein [Povalibacter sp.]
MTSSSEERLPSDSAAPHTARIIPFDRQSELQRAVQQRAQERLDAEAIKPKVPIARRLITFAVALIPVTIIFSGFLLAVHAVRVITSLYATTPATQAAPPAPVAEAPSQPGVVILVPDKTLAPSAQEEDLTQRSRRTQRSEAE